MKKLAWRLSVAILSLVTIAVVLGYFMVRASLPPVVGEIITAGVTDKVVIDRDAAGIPTIRAGNRADLSFATGFVHGQDRFFQMDLMRRKAAGELAELFGAVALPFDKLHRLHRFRSRAERVVKNLSRGEAEILSAYAAGVNAGLASLRARPFEYFLLRTVPRPWYPSDSMLVAFAMFLELDEELALPDIQRGRAHRFLDAEVYRWLYADGSSWDAPLQGEARQAMPIPGQDAIDLRASGSPSHAPGLPGGQSDAPMPGSNNWAVGGKLTASGKAIVASDMHLPIAVPNTFYRARLILHGESAMEVSGLSLPGAPVIVAGSNGTVAWAFTNSYGDWSDAVLIRTGEAEDTYHTPDGLRRFDVYRETIRVSRGQPVHLVVRETVWGPLLGEALATPEPIAIRWIAHEPEAVNLRHLDLEHVQSVSEAMSIANRIGMPPQNFVAGDSNGNIGWTIAGRIPRRTDYDARLPADWSRSGGWLGWLGADAYPRIVNPDSSRIWTANARVVDGKALGLIGDGGYDLGARAGQIRDSLHATDEFDERDMLRIQLDDRALFLTRWRDLLLKVLDDRAVSSNAARRECRDLVDNWEPRASIESVGYRLVREVRLEIRRRVFEMITAPVRSAGSHDLPLLQGKHFEDALWSLLQQQPLHFLAADYSSWDALMLESVDAVIADLAARYDGPLSGRRWGERNTVTIRHPLGAALPVLSGWLDMPTRELPGDVNMPRVQSPGFGASVRFAVTPGDEDRGYLHMPTGQSGHPFSDFYRAGHLDWAEGRPTPFLPADPRYRLILAPGL
jgi:penicillin amidase